MDADGTVLIESWQAAERFAAAHMQVLGLDDATPTGAGADRGLDVASDGGYAQVKHQLQPVSAPLVQNLLGAGASRPGTPIFYAFSGYTRAAVALGEAEKVALFTYTIDGAVGAWSSRAREILDRGLVLVPQGADTEAYLALVASLQNYGQKVADVIPALSASLQEEVAKGNAASWAPGTAQSVTTRLTHAFELAEELVGDRTRNLFEYMAQVIRLERLLQQIAALCALDYPVLERRASESR